jgi:hypothetical protein
MKLLTVGLTRGTNLLVGLLRGIHRSVPLSIRKRYYPFLARWHERLIRLGLDVYFPPVFIFSGRAPKTGRPLAFAYAGTDEIAQEYWARLALADGFTRSSVGRRRSRYVSKRIREAHPECAFVLVEHTDPLLPALLKEPGFRIPLWMDMEVVLPNLSQGGWGHQRRDIARRIRKYGLSYELSKDSSHFQDFLRDMHLPYITERFEEGALQPDADYLSKVLSKGELILVRQGNETVGGCLFEYFPKMVWMRKLGVRGGDWEYVKQGVVGALYYFLMKEMEPRGYEKIYLGGTRPFLNDGVTRFKSSLNARLVPKAKAAGPVALWLSVLDDSPALDEFLISNPFVHFPQPDKPYRAVFTRPEGEGWYEQLEKTLRVSDCRGLVETTVFVLGGKQELFDVRKALSESEAVLNGESLRNGSRTRPHVIGMARHAGAVSSPL